MKRVGLFIVGLIWVTSFPSNGLGNIPRKNWVLEQTVLYQGVQPPKDKSFVRSSLSVVNYSDAISTQIGALYDSGLLEIGVKGSSRLFLGLTDEGKSLESHLTNQRTTIAVELSRSYITRDNHFGRVSAEHITFPNGKTAFLRLGTHMGVFEHKDFDWILRLSFHLFLSLARSEQTTYMTVTDLGRSFSWKENSLVRLGGGFQWTYRTRPENNALDLVTPLRREHMLFSIGPWIEYVLSSSAVRLFVPWRIWLDKESFLIGKETVLNRYPVMTGIPDVALSWIISF